MELIPANTRIDFVGRSKFFVALSVAVVSLSLVLMLVRGFNLGIDFSGGTVIEIRTPEGIAAVDEGRLRAAVREAGYPDAGIVRLGAAEERTLRISLKEHTEKVRDLTPTLVAAIDANLGAAVEVMKVDSIGARVGGEQARMSLFALVASWVLIMIYIWFRFDMKYAPGAVIALVHDVVAVCGVFVLLGWEFDMQIVAALLVIVGYSLNDTIVIYDRIREIVEVRGSTHIEEVVNQALNQTLSRTILTTALTLFVVVAILVVGGSVLRTFAAALLIGMVSGIYSTVYVASATLVYMERRAQRTAAGARMTKAG